MRRLAVAGLVLAVVGLLLVVGFWPLTSVSGAQLRAAQNGNAYSGYSLGTRITIHEKVLNVSYSDFFGSTLTELALDSGDPDNPVPAFVQGDARGVVTPGEVVYMSAVLEQTVFGIEYWQVSTPSDVHAAWTLDAAFYGTVVLGSVLLAAATVTGKDARPEG